VPVRENAHDGSPGAEVEPLAVIEAVVLPFSWPDAVPDTVKLPAQSAENSPEIDVSDWLVTRHWKFPQAVGPETP
jgi:hypothetical protein